MQIVKGFIGGQCRRVIVSIGGWVNFRQKVLYFLRLFDKLRVNLQVWWFYVIVRFGGIEMERLVLEESVELYLLERYKVKLYWEVMDEEKDVSVGIVKEF